MTKLELDLQSFKALSSDTRIDILKTLDGKRLGLNDLSRQTQLTKATLHEHLQKLTDAGLIKKKKRDGHKWVYYKLSWKGSTLLHPENNRVLLLFTSAFAALAATITGVYSYIQSLTPVTGPEERFFIQENDGLLQAPLKTVQEGASTTPSLFLNIAVICAVLFIIFISISIWRYKKNKIAKL